jgi:alpha-1,3-rhamnosyl/mannosyltransferase
MRVGLDGSPLLELKTGVGRYTHELMIALNRFSIDLELFYYYGASWSQHIISRDVDDVRSSGHAVKIALKKWLPVVLKVRIKDKIFKCGYRKNKLDLYHATNYIAPGFDIPLAVTVYDLSFLRYPNAHPANRLAWLAKGFPSTIQRARQVITISEFSKNEINELLGVSKEKMSVAYPGVDSRFKPLNPDFLTQKLKNWSLKPDEYLLSVGTLEPRKNLVNLFKAYELLPDSIKKNWPLVVVGMSGWKEKTIIKEMEVLIRKGNLIPLGYLSDDQLAVIYAGAKLFVYLSLYEGFGLPPLEAMACGTPVVASNRTSLPEVVGDAGILVDPENIESVAWTLESVLDDSKRCIEMSELGQRQASNFTWQACAEKTYKVYQKTLGHNLSLLSTKKRVDQSPK